MLTFTQRGVGTYLFGDDGRIPNSNLPVIVYHGVADFGGGKLNLAELKDAISEKISTNFWYRSWLEKDAVLRYPHLHSRAHEVLLVVDGSATILVGGTEGENLTVEKGDAIAIPAGVVHERVRGSTRFTVAGLYPHDQQWDLIEPAKAFDREAVLREVAKVKLPKADPFFGPYGPLMTYWK